MTDGSLSPEQVGRALQDTILKVFQSVPDCTMRPTDISKKLGVSRTMVSRTISAIGKDNPIETLTSLPGPESLRSMMHAAKIAGVPSDDVQIALALIADFAAMIRDQYGTRAAFNAALSVSHVNTREKFEQSSRYQVFKGMTQILGVECKVWVSSVIVSPNRHEEGSVHLTSFFGPTGLRRLRPDMPILLEYGQPSIWRSGVKIAGPAETIDVNQYYSNPPAALQAIEKNGRVTMTFAPDVQGKDDCYDMILASRREALGYHQSAPGRTTRGRSVIPDLPVGLMVCDYVLHKDIFAGIDPELYVYRTLGKGMASIDDQVRDNDRIDTGDRVMHLGNGIESLGVPDVPKYAKMVKHLCEYNGHTVNDFRTYRLQVQYPVYGFQYIMAFRVRSEE